MAPEQALKLIEESAIVGRDLTTYAQRYDYYVWLEGLASGYLDADEAEERRQLDELRIR